MPGTMAPDTPAGVLGTVVLILTIVFALMAVSSFLPRFCWRRTEHRMTTERERSHRTAGRGAAPGQGDAGRDRENRPRGSELAHLHAPLCEVETPKYPGPESTEQG